MNSYSITATLVKQGVNKRILRDIQLSMIKNHEGSKHVGSSPLNTYLSVIIYGILRGMLIKSWVLSFIWSSVKCWWFHYFSPMHLYRWGSKRLTWHWTTGPTDNTLKTLAERSHYGGLGEMEKKWESEWLRSEKTSPVNHWRPCSENLLPVWVVFILQSWPCLLHLYYTNV